MSCLVCPLMRVMSAHIKSWCKGFVLLTDLSIHKKSSESLLECLLLEILLHVVCLPKAVVMLVRALIFNE